MASKKDIKSITASLIAGISANIKEPTAELLKRAEELLDEKKIKKLKRDVIKGVTNNATDLLDSISTASANQSAKIKKATKKQAKTKKKKQKQKKSKGKSKKRKNQKINPENLGYTQKVQKTKDPYAGVHSVLAEIEITYDYRPVSLRIGPNTYPKDEVDVISGMILGYHRKHKLEKYATLKLLGEALQEIENDPHGSSRPILRDFIKYGPEELVFPEKTTGLTLKKK